MASSIKKGAIISYVAIFLNIAITFFYTPWMIKMIGVSYYGLYSLTISFISYFLLDFGLQQAVQRFIAKYRAEGDEDKVAKMVGITTRVYLIIDIVILLVLIILYFFISNIFTGLDSEEINKLKGLYVIAATFSVLNFVFKPMGGAMMAYEYFVEERLLELINKVGLVLLVCIALYFGAGVYALVFINGSVSLFVSIAKFYVFRKKSKLQIQWSYFDKTELKGIFTFSVWTFGSVLAQRMRFSLIPTVLGIFSNTAEIAVFALGASLEGMVFTIASGINGLFLPKVSRMAHMNNSVEILRLMVRVGRIMLYLIGLIFGGFLVLGKDFILLWVGDQFTNVYYILIFLIVSNIVSLTQNIGENLIYVDNKVKESALLIFATSLIGLIVACILAPNYGAVGCAFGTGFGLCLYQVLINLFYHRRMNIDIICFFKECHIKIMPLLIILIGLLYYIKSLVDITTWSGLFVTGSLFAAIYLVICYCFLFNDEEKALCTSLMRINRKK